MKLKQIINNLKCLAKTILSVYFIIINVYMHKLNVLTNLNTTFKDII